MQQKHRFCGHPPLETGDTGTVRQRLSRDTLKSAVLLRLLERRLVACRGYTLGQRLACFGAKAVQYGTVGLIMGTTGSSLVLGLTSLRTALDSSYQVTSTIPPGAEPPAFKQGSHLFFWTGPFYESSRVSFCQPRLASAVGLTLPSLLV